MFLRKDSQLKVMKFLIILLILSLFMCGCSEYSLSQPIELEIISVSEGKKEYKDQSITKVEYSIKHNSDFVATSCAFMFVSDAGEEFKVIDLGTKMTYPKSEGAHMKGITQKFISHLDIKVKDMVGKFYVNLWSNEVDAGHYKRYIAFDSWNNSK